MHLNVEARLPIFKSQPPALRIEPQEIDDTNESSVILRDDAPTLPLHFDGARFRLLRAFA
jgi:hypothetical protein